MRLFAAIEIPTGVRESLRTLLDRLRPAAGLIKGLSWTRVDNLHITTKFIGEWPETRLEEVKRALQSVTRMTPAGAIEIRVQGIGWFPNVRQPRVVFAGITAGDELKQLAYATDQAMAAIGVSKEDREYSPHLTLARIRTRVPLDSLRVMIDSLGAADFGSFRATAFYLYLSAAGKYTKLAEFGLTQS